MFRIESYKKGIALSTFFNIFNKGLVFITGIIIAYYFGATPETDIFFYVYGTIVIIAAYLMNLNSSVIIPESMKIRAEKGDQNINFLNQFICLYCLVSIVGVLIIIADPIYFFSTVSSFDTEILEKNRTLLYLSIPLLGIISLTTLITDILTSYKFFTLPMLLGIATGLLSITMVFLFHNPLGAQSIFWGYIISYTINLVTLFYLLARKLNWNFRLPKISVPKRVWKNMGFAQLGNLTSMLSLYIPIYLLSGFGSGIITALTFAQQISSLPNTLATTQFSSVAGIKFNELVNQNRWEEVNHVFSNIANLLHFIMIPVSCIIFIYPDDIVSILLGFTSIEADTAAYISKFVKYLGLLLPFYVTNTLFARLFMAARKIKQAFWYQSIFNIIQTCAIYYTVKTFGVMGYPLTVLSIYVLSFISYQYIERYLFGVLNYRKIQYDFLILIIINVLIALAVGLVVSSTTIESPAIKLFSAVAMHGFLILTINQIFNINKTISTQVKITAVRLKSGIQFRESDQNIR